MKTMLSAVFLAAATSLTMAADVDPGVIFGTGVTNGSFTTDTSGGGTNGTAIELGLRARVRYR